MSKARCQEISCVEAMRDTGPASYMAADYTGEPVKGTFYVPELQEAMPSDYFDVEAILDTRWHGNRSQYLVKWVSYPVS